MTLLMVIDLSLKIYRSSKFKRSKHHKISIKFTPLIKQEGEEELQHFKLIKMLDNIRENILHRLQISLRILEKEVIQCPKERKRFNNHYWPNSWNIKNRTRGFPVLTEILAIKSKMTIGNVKHRKNYNKYNMNN